MPGEGPALLRLMAIENVVPKPHTVVSSHILGKNTTQEKLVMDQWYSYALFEINGNFPINVIRVLLESHAEDRARDSKLDTIQTLTGAAPFTRLWNCYS